MPGNTAYHGLMPELPDKPSQSARCLFSIDVEDWYHILDLPSAPPMTQWDSLPSCVEQNFLRLLDILNEKKAAATCFCLGWVAEKFPHLVREAVAGGNEIASHGYAHRLVYQMTPDEFLDDAVRSKKLLEDISGAPVYGYRSAGFSVTKATPWFFDKLAEAGYRYDSSVFPAARGHGGMITDKIAPYRVGGAGNGIIEIPIGVTRILGRNFCFFGGGYLRLFPYPIIRHMARRILKPGRPVNFYIHPREIDPGHPRLPMNLRRRFKSYVNLDTTESKIRRLINDFDCVSFIGYIDENFPSGESD